MTRLLCQYNSLDMYNCTDINIILRVICVHFEGLSHASKNSSISHRTETAVEHAQSALDKILILNSSQPFSAQVPCSPVLETQTLDAGVNHGGFWRRA